MAEFNWGLVLRDILNDTPTIRMVAIRSDHKLEIHLI